MYEGQGHSVFAPHARTEEIMKLRRLDSNDLDLYRRLRLEAVSVDRRTLITTAGEERRKPDEEILKVLAEHCVLAAFDGEEATGMATLMRHEGERRHHVAEVLWVFVPPKHRRRGIAKTLMIELETYAKGVDIEYVELHVVSDNSSAINMYIALGYKQNGTLPAAVKIDSNYYDGIYMVKKI